MSPSPPSAAPTARPRTRLILWLVVGAAIAAGIVLRFTVRSDLWLDEALTVNIAKLPFGDIAGWLRHDGAPPLYYWLLHLWMSVFGDSDVAVRALSALFGLAALPAMYFAGRRIGGKPVAWIAVLLLAVSPFAVRFSSETRMYSLVTLLALLGLLALVRLFERPTGLRALVLAAVTAAGVYTNYWAIYLAAAVGIALVWILWRGPERWKRPSWYALGALVVAALAFLPWLPTFLYQSQHTGTPWGDAILPTTGFVDTLIGFGGGGHAEGAIGLVLLVVLIVLALFGRALDAWRIELDLRTRPGVRLLFSAFVGGLGIGLVASFAAGGAFQARYASAVFPLLLLVVAFGAVVLTDERIRVVVVGLLVVASLVGSARNAVEQRTQAGAIASAIEAAYRPGDLVVYCPDQLGPSVSRLLPSDVDQVVYPTGDPPQLIDWVDYADRNAAANPAVFATKVTRDLAPDAKVFYVWFGAYRTFTGQCEALYNGFAARRGNVEQLVKPDTENFQPMQLTEFAPEPTPTSSGPGQP